MSDGRRCCLSYLLYPVCRGVVGGTCRPSMGWDESLGCGLGMPEIEDPEWSTSALDNGAMYLQIENHHD